MLISVLLPIFFYVQLHYHVMSLLQKERAHRFRTDSAPRTRTRSTPDAHPSPAPRTFRPLTRTLHPAHPRLRPHVRNLSFVSPHLSMCKTTFPIWKRAPSFSVCRRGSVS